MLDEKYQVPHLFLLVGTNPLPNYVAANVLWHKVEEPGKSKIYFVYSDDTAAARTALQSALDFMDDKDPRFENVKVQEANPDNIRNTIFAVARNLDGKIGLNYTGGTKPMAVHAYLALQGLSKLKVQSSYLDAHSLRMIIQGVEIAKVDDPIAWFAVDSVERMLMLHGYNHPKVKRDPIWPNVAEALAQVHTHAETQEIWHSWVRRTFFCEPVWPQGIGESLRERDMFWKTWIRDSLLEQAPVPRQEKYNWRDWKTKTQLKAMPPGLPAEPALLGAVAQQIYHSSEGTNPKLLKNFDERSRSRRLMILESGSKGNGWRVM